MRKPDRSDEIAERIITGTLANKINVNISPSDEWWPFRNQLLVTLSAMQAINDGVSEIYLASVKSDEFHTDGTKKFMI